jgi:TRAP-type C4-dicarboxylate transport system permease small subunit
VKVESIAVIVLAICVFLSFYFAFLSFQMVDETSKKQSIALAVSSLVASVTIFAGLIIYLVIRKFFSAVLNR